MSAHMYSSIEPRLAPRIIHGRWSTVQEQSDVLPFVDFESGEVGRGRLYRKASPRR